jgi:hypothetical protein
MPTTGTTSPAGSSASGRDTPNCGIEHTSRRRNYYYVGGNVGGPISIPKIGFNKNKDKLFFWVGYEKMIQHPYNAPVEMNVPTAGS